MNTKLPTKNMLMENSAGAASRTRERVDVRASEENYGRAKREFNGESVIGRQDAMRDAIPEAKQWGLIRGYRGRQGPYTSTG